MKLTDADLAALAEQEATRDPTDLADLDVAYRPSPAPTSESESVEQRDGAVAAPGPAYVPPAPREPMEGRCNAECRPRDDYGNPGGACHNKVADPPKYVDLDMEPRCHVHGVPLDPTVEVRPRCTAGYCRAYPMRGEDLCRYHRDQQAEQRRMAAVSALSSRGARRP